MRMTVVLRTMRWEAILVDDPCSAAKSRVSVVIPCFNQGIYLGEAIESVLRQGYPNLEILVVDDGSTDTTATVARQYVAVRLIQQSNQGVSASRNLGIWETEGEYLLFLDADDRLLPGALVAQVTAMHENPDAAFVCGGYVCIDEAGRFVDQPAPAKIERDPYSALLQGNFVGMHSNVLYRREMLKNEGGFDGSMTLAEDYELFLRLARRYAVHCHDTRVAEYRLHALSLSRDSAAMLRSVLRVLRLQRDFIFGDPGRVSAYKSGLEYWKDYYARQLVERWSVGRNLGGLSSFVRSLYWMLRYAPREFFRAWTSRRTRLAVPRAVLMAAARLQGCTYIPPAGRVCYGDLRRTTPLSPWFGYDRGLPIDRYYIQRFLAQHWKAIRGRTMEIGDDGYTQMYGRERVSQRDILHVSEDNPRATIVADLSSAPSIPSDTYDCVVLTQTLHLIYDVASAVQTLYRILKPGGVLLVTVPGISQISCDEWAHSWYWGFTHLSLRRLLEEQFPSSSVTVEADGNVLAAVGFLEGIAAGELTAGELDVRDPQYELLITAIATKPGAVA